MTPNSYSIIQAGDDTTANGQTLSLTTATSSAAILIGRNSLVRLVASGPINVRFGSASVGAPTSNDLQTQTNLAEIFDMGANRDYIRLTNGGGSTVTVNIVIISRT